jgi:nitrate/TMAO reductase-like tetraheme cytochrome c subunit
MYENSLHSEAVWERTTGSNANKNNLGDCIRCHDGQGFVNFTKGLTTDARTWTELANGTPVTCASCHDPHGNSNMASVRSTPVVRHVAMIFYTAIGGAQLCMNCHKARSK